MRNLLVGFSVLTTALLLGTGCSDESVTVVGVPEVETGRAAFALASGDYTLEASIQIFNDEPSLADTVVLDESTAGETSVLSINLPVGSYTMALLNDAFTLSENDVPIDGGSVDFVGFNPAALEISYNTTTPVALNFTVDDEFITVAPVANASFTLAVAGACGDGGSCGVGQACAQVESGEPSCLATCNPEAEVSECDGGESCLANNDPDEGEPDGVCVPDPIEG